MLLTAANRARRRGARPPFSVPLSPFAVA